MYSIFGGRQKLSSVVVSGIVVLALGAVQLQKGVHFKFISGWNEERRGQNTTTKLTLQQLHLVTQSLIDIVCFVVVLPPSQNQAVIKARKELGIKGFCAINGKSATGKALYAKAKAIYAA